jgi:hypothetical protein
MQRSVVESRTSSSSRIRSKLIVVSTIIDPMGSPAALLESLVPDDSGGGVHRCGREGDGKEGSRVVRRRSVSGHAPRLPKDDLVTRRATIVSTLLFVAAGLLLAGGFLLWNAATNSAESLRRLNQETNEMLGGRVGQDLMDDTPDRGPAKVAWVLGGISLLAGLIVVGTAPNEDPPSE